MPAQVRPIASSGAPVVAWADVSSRPDYSDTSTGDARRGQHLALRHLVAGQLVGHEHPRLVSQTLEQLTEEPLGCLGVSTRLDENVEHHAVLVDRTPQIPLLAVDRDEHFIEVPLVGRGRRRRSSLV